MNQANSSIPPSVRQELFADEYGNGIVAGWTLVDVLTHVGGFLAQIVGKSTADAAMSVVAESLADKSDAGKAWEQILQDHDGETTEWQLGNSLFELTAIAEYGIILDYVDGVASTEKEREAYFAKRLQEATDFLQKAPLKQWGISADGDSELEKLVMLARNRWALDHGDPVEPAAVAEFGGLTERSVRNMMSGSNRTFRNQDGKIPAADALKWLVKRNEFWNSVWRDQPAPHEVTPTTGRIDEPLFVPVARDGSAFRPGINVTGPYRIGAKGSETAYDNFSEALSALQQLPVPYWRRPNAKGIPGIVRGVRWERLDREYLESIATDPSFKLPPANI